MHNAEDEFDDEHRSAYRSAAGTLLYHALDRPDIQFSTVRCMSGLSCPKLKHLALPKRISRFLVDERVSGSSLEQTAPTKIVAFTDSDWASNEDDRRSVDSAPLFCSGESDFYGLLRGSACALQVRQLLGCKKGLEQKRCTWKFHPRRFFR